MNLPAEKLVTTRVENRPDRDAEYICRRVIDTLLRENVRECVSRAAIVTPHALPAETAASFEAHPYWLQIDHFGDGRMWIPVVQQDFMQQWCLAALPLIWQGPEGFRELHAVADILACFRQGLPDKEARCFIEFEAECETALTHRGACETEREHWFEQWRGTQALGCGADLSGWQQRLLHYDRLAAFQDHPFYPTARAKLGFDVDNLRRYAPEFAPVFELNWLAVPRSLYCPSGEGLPPGWPDFAQVGLDPLMADTHVLLPVHPFVWDNQLEQFLFDSGLTTQAVRAPGRALRVTPTLSVRTLALCDAPAWHVKLPLTIRTLGGRNIRTIKPSTIVDGHRVQTLLARIVEREAQLRGRVVLTCEDTGAHVEQQPFLGFITRRYPESALRDATLLPIAALAADTPANRKVVDEVIARFFGGEGDAFLDEYLALTLHLHLMLWVRYGIALESNQQNSMLVLNDRAPRIGLLLKDNDAARIHREHLARRWPSLAAQVADLQDQRIVVDDALPLAQMFTTITLQLNIAAVIETVAKCWKRGRRRLYATVRRHLVEVLAELEAEGEDVAFARDILLNEDKLYIKYLLVAATLVDKETTGAADVNKYYGRSAPNFLRETE